MFWIDTIVLIFQYLFYRVTYQAQKDQIELETEQSKVEKQLEDDIKLKLKVNLKNRLKEKDKEMIDNIPVSQKDM